MTGAMEFVVQEALDTTTCFAESYSFSLTPRTMVMSASPEGALTMTLSAPASMCFEAASFFVKRPVHSMT